MKKAFLLLLLPTLSLFIFPVIANAAGISATGGGNKYIGETFTVAVTASGTTFDSLQGTIAVTGPVKVLSFSPGTATWLPGKEPGNNTQFVGIVTPTDTLKIATIKLQGTGAGNGSVNISGVKLALKGAVVGDDASKASFSFDKKPTPPGLVKVTSESHPDQNSSYESNTIQLSWALTKGILGFSYLLDQDPNTVPAAKSIGKEVNISYTDKAIGAYYFHIRSQNSDGWGETTHFKINIKEPAAKIDETLSAPVITKIEKADSFINNIKDGNVSGIKLSGTTLPGFTVSTSFLPAITPPEGKTLSALADDQGKWELSIDFPVGSGARKVTLQGQKDKVLTPFSPETIFELSQVAGGKISILTDIDIDPPKTEGEKVKGEKISFPNFDFSNTTLIYQGIAILMIIFSGIAAVVLYLKKNVS